MDEGRTLPEDGYLASVSAVSANDVWAVGSVHSDGVINHWNGMEWRQTIVQDTNLAAVSASAADDVWAVGTSESGQQTVIEHWDGHAWSSIDPPQVGVSTRIRSVVSLSTTDVWVVGSYFTGSRTKVLTAHWDGTSWTPVHSPEPPDRRSLCQTSALSRPTDIWAVGNDDGSSGEPALVEHWNGTSVVTRGATRWKGSGPIRTASAPSPTRTSGRSDYAVP